MKKIILIFLSIWFFSASCDKDKLNPLPQTDIPEAESFTTAIRAEQQAVGMYIWAKGSYFLGSRFFTYNDVRGEDFLNRTTNGVTGLQTWNFTVVPATNEVQYTWRDIYQCINQCNFVLEGIDKAPITTAAKNEYKGEARFLRALSYHSLLMLYARPFSDGNGNKPGVPLRLVSNTKPGEANLARSTVAQVYQQILDDLNFAETNLPVTRSNAELNTTRAHRNSAIALKTRVLLHMQRWSDVITEAAKIVSAAAPYQASTGVQHRLETNIANVFASSTTLESIFSVPFTPSNLPGTQNGLASYYTPAPVGIMDYYLNTAGIFGNAGWKATDARRAMLGIAVINAVTFNYLNKFNKNPNTDYAPVIRYAEILLNLAEARVRSTNTVDADAIALLNAVRRRSDNTTTFAAGDFADANALLNQIYIERRIELMGEGFRSPDITRNQQNFIAKTGVALVIPANDVYIWPIPFAELSTNTACTQNPGY
jgi:starch-binding outer membrane protein, SusD/RagB family